MPNQTEEGKRERKRNANYIVSESVNKKIKRDVHVMLLRTCIRKHFLDNDNNDFNFENYTFYAYHASACVWATRINLAYPDQLRIFDSQIWTQFNGSINPVKVRQKNFTKKFMQLLTKTADGLDLIQAIFNGTRDDKSIFKTL